MFCSEDNTDRLSFGCGFNRGLNHDPTDLFLFMQDRDLAFKSKIKFESWWISNHIATLITMRSTWKFQKCLIGVA